MTPRGRGHIPDSPHRRKLFGAMREVVATLPTSAGLERFEAPILDQGPTSSCGGHGTAQLLACALAAAGIPLPFVASPDGIYRDARCMSRPAWAPGTTPPALTDSGIAPSDLCAVLHSIGVRPMHAPAEDGRNSDVNPDTVNREPQIEELAAEDAHTLDTTAVRIIDPTAANAASLVKQALAADASVGVGLFADTAFEAWGEGGRYVEVPRLETSDVNDPNPGAGWHWVCGDAFRLEADGTSTLSGPNSWGMGWGAPSLLVAEGAPGYQGAGHWRLSLEGWLKAGAISDLIVFDFHTGSST